jgi:hypothetical protein
VLNPSDADLSCLCDPHQGGEQDLAQVVKIINPFVFEAVLAVMRKSFHALSEGTSVFPFTLQQMDA